MRLRLTVNGQLHELDVEPRLLLAHLLRERLDLTGTHIGCDTTQCGACTVLVEGKAVKSCTMLAVEADGYSVQTVEGLASATGLHPIQTAFAEKHGLQCGFCTPGMMMMSLDLLQRMPCPSREQIREELDGNICRCTGYQQIVDAVEFAGELLAAANDPG